MKNYVVKLLAPISVRVRASSKRQAAVLAVKHMSDLQEIHAICEKDDEPLWLERDPWTVDVGDIEGGVYLAEGTSVINEEVLI